MSLRELSLFDRKLPEETLHPLEDILVLDRFGMLETGLLRQLFDQPFLLGTELRGDRDVDHDQFVTAAIAVDVGQPLAAQPQQRNWTNSLPK